MLTTGARLYTGFALFALLGALLFGLASGDTSGPDYFQIIDRSAFKGVISLGWQGGIGEHTGYVILVFAGLTSLFLALSTTAWRDADPLSVAQISDDGTLPPAQAATRPSYWPAVLAVGLGVTIIGLAVQVAIMVIGLVVVAVATVEWALSAWSDRASADPQINKAVRNRLLWPVEVPVIGVASIGVAVIGIWRVLIAVSEFSALWVATGIAAVVFLVAVLFSASSKVAKPVVVLLVAFAAVGVIVAGIIATAVGSRDFHELHHADQKSQSISAPAHDHSTQDHG